MKRFLIIRTDRMGDVILSTPVLTAIKKSFPLSYTAMLVKPYAEQVVSGHPDLDEVMLYDEKNGHAGFNGLAKQARALKDRHFDIAILLHPDFRLALLCRLANIPVRLGTAYRLYSFLLNNRVPVHRKNSGKHELDLNIEMVKDIDASLETVEFKFYIPPDAKERVRQVLVDRGIVPGTPFVVLHPGSGGSALDWPAERFGRLGQRIRSELNVPVIVTGTSAEKSLVDEVLGAAQKQLIRLDGLFNIKELAALLQASTLCVANSTGPLHLARALETEVIGLYCPLRACSPTRWGPYQRMDSIIMPYVETCKTCSKNKCEHGNCMTLISVERVYSLVCKKLARNWNVHVENHGDS